MRYGFKKQLITNYRQLLKMSCVDILTKSKKESLFPSVHHELNAKYGRDRLDNSVVW